VLVVRVFGSARWIRNRFQNVSPTKFVTSASELDDLKGLARSESDQCFENPVLRKLAPRLLLDDAPRLLVRSACAGEPGRTGSPEEGRTQTDAAAFSLLPLLLALVVSQTAPPPDTEVYLAAVAVRDGRLTFGPPLNISSNPGYDNQPSFTPDGAAVLFTSVRGDRKPDPTNTAASGSDIYRYDIASGRTLQLTDTPESEYSPTVTPDRAHVSTVRVEAGGTQRLWRFSIDGRDPELVLADIKPVGYHAWIDDHTVALYVLAMPGQPATLQVADTRTGKASTVASAIGRSIQLAPDGTVSFVKRAAGDGSGVSASLTVHRLDPRTMQTTMLVAVPSGATEADIAWTPDGTLLVAQGSTLYGWRIGDHAFQPVGDLAALGLRGVTRLSVSPKGDRMALVAQAPLSR
jgi:WD40-like Beta Propeller Repeat